MMKMMVLKKNNNTGVLDLKRNDCWVKFSFRVKGGLHFFEYMLHL